MFAGIYNDGLWGRCAYRNARNYVRVAHRSTACSFSSHQLPCRTSSLLSLLLLPMLTLLLSVLLLLLLLLLLVLLVLLVLIVVAAVRCRCRSCRCECCDCTVAKRTQKQRICSCSINAHEQRRCKNKRPLGPLVFDTAASLAVANVATAQ